MKAYKIEVERKGRATIYEGTIEYLVNHVFGYTLEIGASWNKKINRRPKTISSFLSNLQKSYDEKEACCYNRTSVKLIK
jgi:hypothetical protein